MKNTFELIKLYYFACKFKKINRATKHVRDEYSSSWDNWAKLLRTTATVEEFIRINDQNKKGLFLVDNKFSFGFCDDSFYVETILSILRNNFQHARTVIEFGSGPGRNLLFLKKKNPNWKMIGFELTKSGVALAKKASKKFKLKINVRHKNILKLKPGIIGDVGFTCFALEQINVPIEDSKRLIMSLLGKVRFGLVLIEPLLEYYPKTIRGYFARKFHKKIGYCETFASACEELVSENKIKFWSIPLKSCHNPLLFPSILIIEKRSSYFDAKKN